MIVCAWYDFKFYYSSIDTLKLILMIGDGSSNRYGHTRIISYTDERTIKRTAEHSTYNVTHVCVEVINIIYIYVPDQ